jgi:Bacteriocin-protection, YdeI or OmpD-Associated
LHPIPSPELLGNMFNQPIFEKLQLKDEKNILIQGLPSSIEKQFSKLNYSKNITPLLKSRKVDFALLFALSQHQLNNILREVFPAIHDDTKLWISYPKTASKIVSDLNRDCSWEELYKKDYTCVRQVILDHVWTAMRFIKTSQVPNQERAFAEINVTHSLSFNKSLVVPPIELGKLFTKHKEAQEFFTSLPVTNQKEYCSWIESAKKAETRQFRLETALERLLAGKNNPAEK